MGYDVLNPFTDICLTHASSFFRDDRFLLVGGVDIDEYKRNTFENIYDAPGYLEIKDALLENDVDIVVISVPSKKHISIVRQVFEYSRPKMIFCEKPIALNYRDAKEVNNICVANNCNIYVNYPRRSSPSGQWVKHIIDNKLEGSFIKGTVVYSGSGIHNGSHFLDICEFWFGNITNYTFHSTSRIVEHGITVFFENCEICFVQAPEHNYSLFEVSLFTSIGVLRYKNGGKDVFWEKVVDDGNYSNYKVLDNNIKKTSLVDSEGQLDVLNDIYLAMEGFHNSLCTGLVAANHVRIFS